MRHKVVSRYQRTQLLVSALRRKVLHSALSGLMVQLYGLPEGRKVRWSLDMDPQDLQ